MEGSRLAPFRRKGTRKGKGGESEITEVVFGSFPLGHGETSYHDRGEGQARRGVFWKREKGGEK